MTGTFIYVIDNSKISGNNCGLLLGCYHLTCASKVLPTKGSRDISNAEIVSEVVNLDYLQTIKNFKSVMLVFMNVLLKIIMETNVLQRYMFK